MHSVTGASNKFSSPYQDSASFLRSDVTSPTMISSPASRTAMPTSSLQTTIVPTLDGIDLAGRLLELNLKNDHSFPSLSEQLKHGETYGVSGLSDLDYPMLESGPNGLPLLRQMGLVNRVPLPPELVEHFGHMQSYCMMGLFPNIGRGWLSIDSDIYVWTYEDGGDLSYFDGLSEPIIAVELVTPKPGIFKPHIQFLLCLATTVEIVLLGVSFTGSNSSFEEMHLLPEPLFALPTDGAYIVTIKGTSDGRIFMGAKDGCIYEFVYQAEEGFFGRKCRKINHSKSALSFLVPSFINAAFSEDDPIVQVALDETRHILYTRSEKGTLQLYDLGTNGQSMTRISALSASSIAQSAANIARTVDRSCFKPIVNISAIPSTDSINLHLVAITSSGVRLHFTTLQWRTINDATPSTRPTTLQLFQVRLPPGYSANASPQRPQNVHSALYSKGTTFLATATPSENDVVWTLSGALFPASQQLSETQNTVSLDGKTWALAEVPSWSRRRELVPGLPPAPEPPLVVTQHAVPPRQFIFLTTQCCHIITQLRPVDILRQLLLDASGPNSTAVRAFFQVLREEQACATALILACSTSIQDAQLVDWATRAIFMYGGETRVVSALGLASPSSPFLATPQTPGVGVGPFATFSSPVSGGFNPNAISTPQMAASSSFIGADQTASGEVQFSGRHNGLYLYFGRILIPVWLIPLARELGKDQLLDSVVTSEELIQVLSQLNALKSFVNAHILPRSSYQASDKGRVQQDAQMQENKSLTAMKQLLDHTIQVLSLWKVLGDHQLHLLAQSVSNEIKMSLKTMLFRDLILSGGDICVALINALIHRYLDDAANTDAISEKLRQVCPSLYRNEDALSTKINEQLLKARTGSLNRSERDRILRQTIDLCKQIPSKLNVSHVCQQLAACGYFWGVVDLCCAIAEKVDPHRRAVECYHGRAEDPAAVEALIARKNCYQQICEVLQQLYSFASSHPQSPSVPKSPGPAMPLPQIEDASQLSPAEAKRLADETLSLALQSEDELCHVAIFDWLTANKRNDTLLEIHSPYLENYLQKHTTHADQGDLVASFDLLWKYYEKSKQFMAAARVLSRLSETHSTIINLPSRVEYLSRAIVNARAAETSSFGNAMQGQFLYELEEKMDVAKVQSQVLDAVTRLPGNHSEFISRLNADLLDVTQLFEQFADPLGLWECKLAILHCAGHQDAALVANVWLNIINNEVKKLSLVEDTEAKMAALGNKMKTLAQNYGQSEQFFPIELIVNTMEVQNVKWNGPPGWVPSIMLGAGIPFQKLFATYGRLYAAKDSIWQAEGRPNHLLHVLADMLNRLVDSPGAIALIPTSERRVLAGQCLEAVEIYLTDLYCTAHASSPSLIAEFRAIQGKLERL